MGCWERHAAKGAWRTSWETLLKPGKEKTMRLQTAGSREKTVGATDRGALERRWWGLQTARL